MAILRLRGWLEQTDSRRVNTIQLLQLLPSNDQTEVPGKRGGLYNRHRSHDLSQANGMLCR
jgi:hypothetical protein